MIEQVFVDECGDQLRVSTDTLLSGQRVVEIAIARPDLRVWDMVWFPAHKIDAIIAALQMARDAL